MSKVDFLALIFALLSKFAKSILPIFAIYPKTRLKINFSADREYAMLRGPINQSCLPTCFDI